MEILAQCLVHRESPKSRLQCLTARLSEYGRALDLTAVSYSSNSKTVIHKARGAQGNHLTGISDQPVQVAILPLCTLDSFSSWRCKLWCFGTSPKQLAEGQGLGPYHSVLNSRTARKSYLLINRGEHFPNASAILFLKEKGQIKIFFSKWKFPFPNGISCGEYI